MVAFSFVRSGFVGYITTTEFATSLVFLLQATSMVVASAVHLKDF